MKAVPRCVIILLVLCSYSLVSAQKWSVLNEKGKKVYQLKKGRNIDFRVDYNTIYPEGNDSILEARMFSLVDSIQGDEIYLSESFVILYFSKSSSILIEKGYEYTDLSLNINEIKGLSFSPTLSSVGRALLTIGLATILASPILGITPSGYSTSRFATVATIGAGTAFIGGGLTLAFGQKPIKFKDFDGPDYFKKYQRGSLSSLQE